jgi:hypothetical protein
MGAGSTFGPGSTSIPGTERDFMRSRRLGRSVRPEVQHFADSSGCLLLNNKTGASARQIADEKRQILWFQLFKRDTVHLLLKYRFRDSTGESALCGLRDDDANNWRHDLRSSGSFVVHGPPILAASIGSDNRGIPVRAVRRLLIGRACACGNLRASAATAFTIHPLHCALDHFGNAAQIQLRLNVAAMSVDGFDAYI